MYSPIETETRYEGENLICTIETHYDEDYSPEDYLGQIHWQEIHKGIPLRNGRSYDKCWFVPSNNFEDSKQWHIENGDSIGTAHRKAQSYILADSKRMQDYLNDYWHYIGIVVTIQSNVIGESDREIGHASVWGIESDCGDYIEETKRELVAEAISEARRNIWHDKHVKAFV